MSEPLDGPQLPHETVPPTQEVAGPLPLPAPGALPTVLGPDEVVARAQLALGNHSEARDAISRALAITKQSPAVRLDAAIVSAQVRAASGRPEDRQRSRTDLAAAALEASSRGLVLCEMRATLALGEQEMNAGLAAQARPRLAELSSRAEAKGLVTIARDARSAASR